MKTLTVLLMTICVALLFSGCDKNEPSSADTSMHGDHADHMDHMNHDEHMADTTEEMAMTESDDDEIIQTTCPVMEGNPIDKNLFVEYKGKKVYFCCDTCVSLFEKDPEKYISKLPQFKTDETVASVATPQQTQCPVMGGPINKDIFIEYKGKKVYFCCDGCDDKFLADPEKYLAKLPQFGGKEE